MSHPTDRPKRPASERKRAANRANAQKSTGPRTPQGKARVSLNRLTHGLTAHAAILPFENPDHFEKFADALRRELRPSGFLQTLLAERIVDLAWKLRRSSRAQSVVACEYLVSDLRGHQIAAEHGYETGRYVRTVDGPKIVADAATYMSEEGGYLRLDLYADRLQRSLLSALTRLRQEQARDAAGEGCIESVLDVEVELGADEAEAAAIKATAGNSEAVEPDELSALSGEVSDGRPVSDEVADEEPNSQNKATAAGAAAGDSTDAGDEAAEGGYGGAGLLESRGACQETPSATCSASPPPARATGPGTS